MNLESGNCKYSKGSTLQHQRYFTVLTNGLQPWVLAAWHGMEATESLPLRLSHGAVTTASGALVLDALPATSFATDDAAAASHGGLLLGFRSGTGGPASLLDLPLGLVSAASITPCKTLAARKSFALSACTVLAWRAWNHIHMAVYDIGLPVCKDLPSNQQVTCFRRDAHIIPMQTLLPCHAAAC